MTLFLKTQNENCWNQGWAGKHSKLGVVSTDKILTPLTNIRPSLIPTCSRIIESQGAE